MGSDYLVNHGLLCGDDPKQVIIIKRYDDNGGVYTANVVTWPEVEDEQGWETTKVIGFLKDEERFRRDLVASGFVAQHFNALMPKRVEPEFGEEQSFQDYVTYSILPVEWHNMMHDDLWTSRVQVYVKN